MPLTVMFCKKGRKYLFLLSFLFYSGYLPAQTVSLNAEALPFEKVLSLLEKQSSYRFIYSTESLVSAKPVTVTIANKPFLTALDLVFRDQPLSFTIQDQFVTIQRKAETYAKMIEFVKGRVVNEEGEVVAGVTVTVKGTGNATSSRGDGQYILQEFPSDAILVFTCIGYERMEVPVKGRQVIDVKLIPVVTNLDAAVVIAYGTTTQRLNTGSVGRVASKEIAQQPVTNPLLALHGRVPGVLITQSSGVPGAAVRIQVRGQQSILAGNDPLFIIDGVPFAPGNSFLNQLTSSAGSPSIGANSSGLSPFSVINPSDIESIEILKDADATAIYGSRGANGVVLITTKKAKGGNTQVSVNYYTGFSKVASSIAMMNTQQYVAMRKEALANDGLTPNNTNAYDLLLWDTTRYTNFTDLLIGGTARQHNLQAGVSGGSLTTQFRLTAGYNHETTVYPGDLSDKKGSVNLSLFHRSQDNKFRIHSTVSFASNTNNLNSADLTSNISMAPNTPPLYDTAGKLAWSSQGVSFSNPLALLLRKYSMKSDYLNSDLQLQYAFLPGLTGRLNAGYNSVHTDELSLRPKASLPTTQNVLPSSTFGNGAMKSWVIEPQLEFNRTFRAFQVSAIAGGTLQQQTRNSSAISGTNYVNDDLLYSPAGAGQITVDASNSQYKYRAVFGRVTLNRNNTYILNLSGRRDGSSRFGPGRQFANFGAIGAAWIFSNEKFVYKAIPFLSFGKIRGSIGVTGNDQIGDYQYRDAWTVTSTLYNDTSGLQPRRLFNPDFAWESNRKLETTLELGFLQNAIYLTATYYHNVSDNQLINFTLPSQTGFSSILRNSDATIRNTGFEFLLNFRLLQRKAFRWSSNFNITVPESRLVAFPGMELTSYWNQYTIGKPLTAIRAYDYLGVDPSTGVYSFRDLDNNGSFTGADRILRGDLDPAFYGGWGHSVSYGLFELDLFFEFRRQKGLTFQGTQLTNYVPGLAGINQPAFILDRWQKPGDIAPYQRYTASTSSAATNAVALVMPASNGIFGDASFARLKTLSLSYRLSEAVLKRLHVTSFRCYIQCQNLATLTRYKGLDPERQNLYKLPPLRTLTAGLQIVL